MKLYSVKQYAGTTFKSVDDTNAETIEGSTSELCKELETNKSYHLRINAELPCIVFGDIDHCPSEKTFENFLDVIMNVFDVPKKDISYSLSVKENEYSYHWSIFNIETDCSSLKSILSGYEFASFKSYIDLSVYCNKWFRLPNQSNKDKPFIHKIVQGKMKHFLIHNVKHITSTVLIPIAPVTSDEPSNNTLSEIKTMVSKMTNYFDVFDEWSKLGFIIWNETKGSDEGLDMFNELSKQFKKYDEKSVNKLWYGIKSKESSKLTIKSLRLWFNKLFPSQNSIYNNPTYIEQKTKFEKRIFKLDEPFNFIKINTNNQLELMNLKCLKEWACGEVSKIEMTEGDNVKLFDFVDVWKDDPNKLKYNKIVFDPSKSLEDKSIYNLWKGFEFGDESITPVIESESKYLQLLKRVVNDVNIYEYVKQWIAHIIQKPFKKTNVAIVLYSDTKGIGKNCIIDGIGKLLKNYTAKVGNIEDITRNFNAHLVNKLFISGDEICAKATAVSNKLKEVITRTEQNLEKKGKDAIPVDDYTNWLFTTNNYDAFKIENGDRRLEMIHCFENKLNADDSIGFYEEINNPNEMNKLFNYFKQVKITHKIGIEAPPMTQYKQNLEYNNKPCFIQMIYKEPNEIIGQSLSSTQLLKQANDYAKSHYLQQYNDIITFGKIIGEIFKAYKKRSSTTYVYNFKDVDIKQFRKVLYDYDNNYFKYVNHLDFDETPSFSVPTVSTVSKSKMCSCTDWFVCKSCNSTTINNDPHDKTTPTKENEDD
jgi:hypothetical protein